MNMNNMMNTIMMGSVMKGSENSLYISILAMALISIINYCVNNYRDIYENCNKRVYSFTTIKISAKLKLGS